MLDVNHSSRVSPRFVYVVGSRHRLRQRKLTTSDNGFSLVELIVVVVVLGVVAAVVIPILNGIEDRARASAVQAIAAEAATGAAADLAQDVVPTTPVVDAGFTATWKNGIVPTQVDEVCVVATRADTGESAESGPGC